MPTKPVARPRLAGDGVPGSIVEPRKFQGRRRVALAVRSDLAIEDQVTDGSGTIRFGRQPSFWTRSNNYGAMTPSLDPMPQLLAINDARSVYQLIQETQAAT
jgi:hypothetical protein